MMQLGRLILLNVSYLYLQYLIIRFENLACSLTQILSLGSPIELIVLRRFLPSFYHALKEWILVINLHLSPIINYIYECLLYLVKSRLRDYRRQDYMRFNRR